MRNHRRTPIRVGNLAARNRQLHIYASAAANKADLTDLDKKRSINSIPEWSSDSEGVWSVMAGQRVRHAANRKHCCMLGHTDRCTSERDVCVYTLVFSSWDKLFFECGLRLLLFQSEFLSNCVYDCLALCACVCLFVDPFVCVCLFRRDDGVDQMTTTREDEESRP